MSPRTHTILVLLAGTNEPSNSAALAAAFCEGAMGEPGIATKTIRIRDLTIEHFSVDFYDPKKNQGKDFNTLRTLVENASGVVIATPVWNFSVPAHLKNLIDRMGSFGLDTATRSHGQLEGKPFFLIFTGGAPAMAWRGMMRLTTGHVPEAIKYYGGTVTGIHYEGKCTERSDKIFALVVDKRPDTLERMRQKGRQFAKTSVIHKETGELPTYKKLYRLFYEWGQRIVEKL